MPRFVIKLKDKKNKKVHFLLWSTIVDAPVQTFEGLDDATKFLKENCTPSVFKESMDSLKRKGISNPHYSIDDVINCNIENCSTVEDLIKTYCNPS